MEQERSKILPLFIFFRKEICVHRMLSHENIVKFYGHRKAEQVQYLFLEYASGGELFDR